MGLSPKLEMRHGQQLVMTPQLQQAIRLLQYSNIELAAFVETELERNPLLEHDAAWYARHRGRQDDRRTATDTGCTPLRHGTSRGQGQQARAPLALPTHQTLNWFCGIG